MQPTTPTAPAEEDPFQYGWRFVKRQLPDGSVDLDQVPITLEDVLHPQEEDVMPRRPIEEMDTTYLTSAFRTRPLSPSVGWVASRLLIDWNVAGVRPHMPDIAVFVGLKGKPDIEKGTLSLAEMGGRCVLVVEVVAPDTRVNDAVHKVRHYHQVGIPLYVLVDQLAPGGPLPGRVPPCAEGLRGGGPRRPGAGLPAATGVVPDDARQPRGVHRREDWGRTGRLCSSP